MKTPFIIGEKIYFRAVEMDDANLLLRCNNQPEVRETFFIAFPSNINRQELDIKNLYDRQDYIPFIICEKETDRAVGITAFHRVDLVSRAAVFSIHIADPADWGKGFGGEATRMMLKYGFDQLNLNRIQLVVSTENERGHRAYLKSGFVQEGIMRQAMYHHDRYSDFYLMSILREEYYKHGGLK